MKRILFTTALLIFVIALFGKTMGDVSPLDELEYNKATASIVPVTDYKVHTVGDLYLTVSNWGVFGSSRGDNDTRRCDPFILKEGMEICDIPAGQCIPSGEYPGCSGIEYLFQGCFWFGAVVDGDTLVSVGHDGWFHVQEMFPSRLEEDTITFNSIYLDTTVKAEEEYYSEFTDTSQDRSFVNENHRPIGIKVGQQSYAWSYDYAKNFVFIKFYIDNIREDGKTLEDVYYGVYLDGDVGHIETVDYAQDDITGYIKDYSYFQAGTLATEEINIAWIADNDGDPVDGRFENTSPTGAMAFKVLYPDVETYSFNWWISNSNEDLDWGPMLRSNYTGWDGTPETDVHKYQLLSSGEKDYDQTQIGDSVGGDWNELPSTADDLRDGYDTRFLISFGPFDIAPDDPTDSLIVAFMVGDDFHIDPSNTGSRWDPSRFRKDKIADAAVWVQRIFENNYKGPQPPPAPEFEVEINPYELVVYWKDNAEDAYDPITELEDFEGYRIYISDWNLDEYYTPLSEFDIIDYYRYASFNYYEETGGIEPQFDDNIYYEDSSYTAVIYSGSDTLRDTTFTNFMEMSLNNGMPPETTWKGEEWYYYKIKDLRPGADRYVVVTSFDYGKLSEGLKPLESNKKNNAKWVVPVGDGSLIEGIYVWPNPYRVDGNYYGESGLWAEGTPTSTWTEYSRGIHFVNLPSKCTIRIFTLDGDVVDQFTHDDTKPGTVQGGETWDMINRNDQSIVSGIYLYSVEDAETGENTLGKFVIIK
ncbi:MAG: hypothetical protein ACLFSQ_07175 [Candidatus Zixiibacteriota bacterium]